MEKYEKIIAIDNKESIREVIDKKIREKLPEIKSKDLNNKQS